jgi:hypothetical protein
VTFTAGVAVSLAAALILKAAGRWNAVSNLFACAGLVFLVLAIAFPSWPRHPLRNPDRRRDVNERPQHHAVVHPGTLLAAGKGGVARANEWLATHLAIVFGAVWTVWVFFIWPLIAPALSPAVQGKTSYYAQSWVQLFALPLFVWVGNRLQKSADAQSDAQHQALTHIAVTGDDVKTLIEQNNELTAQVHALVAALPKPPAPKTLVRNPAIRAERGKEGSGA